LHPMPRFSNKGKARSRPLRERFEEKVERLPGGCWRWLACTTQGYGRINDETGRQRQAQQVAWELHHGEPFPAELFACHTCDNRWCVNPEHVFPGTQLDNIRDMDAKGRRRNGVPGGERHYKAQLTDEIVRQIRSLCDQGWKHADIARAFNVDHQRVYGIANRRIWKHVQVAA
jgi:hypothetical protein